MGQKKGCIFKCSLFRKNISIYCLISLWVTPSAIFIQYIPACKPESDTGCCIEPVSYTHLLSANYHLPVWCPDWGFGNILYIQRFRANLFYDFTKVYSVNKSQTRDQRSVGGELFADTKWWNQYPLTFGIRISRLLDLDQYDGFKGNYFEFVMPVSIFPR